MGTLKYLVDPARTSRDYDHLVGEGGKWVERDDVWIVDLARSGPLTVGYGGDEGRIGPELEFGHVVGDFFESPVLLIKTAWGGKSLHVDFRPPSAGGEVGPSYTEMVQRVHAVLDDIAKHYPGYNGQGFELAGIAWHQGWNDRVDQTANDAYQDNAVHLINDLRAEFGVPRLPFALATTGMTGWEDKHPRALSLMNAQLALPDDTRITQGRVAAVETRDFWRPFEQSPANQGFHWNQNAETFLLIGGGLGKAMVKLVEEGCASEP
jgi:alpha-galactosidase